MCSPPKFILDFRFFFFYPESVDFWFAIFPRGYVVDWLTLRTSQSSYASQNARHIGLAYVQHTQKVYVDGGVREAWHSPLTSSQCKSEFALHGAEIRAAPVPIYIRLYTDPAKQKTPQNITMFAWATCAAESSSAGTWLASFIHHSVTAAQANHVLSCTSMK